MVGIEELLQSLDTGAGFWNPIVWVVAAVVIFLIVYLIRSSGNQAYKKQTEQTKAFLSGNKEYSSEKMHVKASNLYWGFTKSMEGLYTLLKRMHNGNVSDYVLWFVIVLVIFLVIEVI